MSSGGTNSASISGPRSGAQEAQTPPLSGWARIGLWLLLVPGLGQLLLLCIAMFSRIGYPYDLEWMEGGLLTHAQRVADGTGIYVEPSVDFIPYLYTPLYPGIIGMLSPLFGISYWVGRALSIASTLGLCILLVLMVRRESDASTKKLTYVGGVTAIGFFAATYPWVEGWYDLVRADSLFMLMIIGGLWGVRNWSRTPGMEGVARLACAASLLGLSFFAKQTGVFFVATGGFLVLVLNWRRVPIYIAVTGLLGLGGTWLLNKMSAKWFWVYIYETHQHHDFNMDRFYKSFGNMLWHFPVMTIVIAIGIFLTLATLIGRRRVPAAARGLALWTPVFAVAVLVGAIGWGTEFAHFNAYIPAMLFGALCAGLAIPCIAGCIALWLPADAPSPWLQRAGMLAALALAVQLGLASWSPAKFIPSEKEYQAGHQLIHTLREVEGDVFIPYHPWYARLAGKDTKVHLMGLRDMSTGKVWEIRGLQEALTSHAFGAIVFDNRPVGPELRAMQRNYRMDDYLPASASPHVFTGAGAVWNKAVSTLVPRSIWVPNRPLEVPAGTRVLWNFEDGKAAGWTSEGGKEPTAWGRRAVSRPLAKQGPVRRYGGRYYLSSFHGGDAAKGTLRSPPFVIDSSSLSFRISGGSSENLRVELHVDSQVLKSVTGDNSERMQDITWNLAAAEGKTATIVLIDDESGSWGHLNVDEFWIH
ncbi:MAG: hypothetical protein GY811_29705 [Myxococcales bacterium]|nr:hypothetical protein [Myxococcales bacterium]